jgi:hypothetical protein
MLSAQASDEGHAPFILETQRHDKQVIVIPQRLNLDEIHAMLGFVAGAFGWIKFKVI